MDVLMLSGDLGSGGASRVVYQISRHLPPDIDTTVAYLGGDSYLTQKFERQGIPVVRLADRPTSPVAVRELYRLIRGHSPDVVHTHMMTAGVLGRPIAALHDTPTVHTVHTNYRKRPPVAKYLDVLSAPFGRCAVCVSDSVERSLPRYYWSGTTVIHNCIDVPEILREGESEWEELEWTGDLDPDAPVIANVARYDPKKRRCDIIEGFERVVADHPSAQLVLTGHRDGRQAQLAALARKRGIAENVFFVGFVESPQTVYHHADVIIFGSESEGFSVGLLEAMAHRRPIIATDIPAFVEALGEDYPGLVPVRSPVELGERLADVLADERQREELAELAASRVEPFTGSIAADKYVDIYRRLGGDGE